MMDARKYGALSRDLRESMGCPDGAAEELVADIQEASAFVVGQLDRHPELKLGVRFLLLGTAKALTSKRTLHTCLGRPPTDGEAEAIDLLALTVARTASQIRTA